MNVPQDYPAAFADSFEDSSSAHDLTVTYELGLDDNSPEALRMALAFVADFKKLADEFNAAMKRKFPFEEDDAD